jgi:hypothetical protein
MTIRHRGAVSALSAAAALAALALPLAACGTERASDGAGPVRQGTARAAVPTAPTDIPCPGETPAPAPSATPTRTPDGPPTDHWLENNGFKIPIPLHGQERCDALAETHRIRTALAPLAKARDFTPDHTAAALTRLGYSPSALTVTRSGPTAVHFLVNATTHCLEGDLYPTGSRTDAFAGYPDHTGCDQPRGGH